MFHPRGGPSLIAQPGWGPELFHAPNAGIAPPNSAISASFLGVVDADCAREDLQTEGVAPWNSRDGRRGVGSLVGSPVFRGVSTRSMLFAGHLNSLWLLGGNAMVAPGQQLRWAVRCAFSERRVRDELLSGLARPGCRWWSR